MIGMSISADTQTRITMAIVKCLRGVRAGVDSCGKGNQGTGSMNWVNDWEKDGK